MRPGALYHKYVPKLESSAMPPVVCYDMAQDDEESTVGCAFHPHRLVVREGAGGSHPPPRPTVVQSRCSTYPVHCRRALAKSQRYGKAAGPRSAARPRGVQSEGKEESPTIKERCSGRRSCAVVACVLA